MLRPIEDIFSKKKIAQQEKIPKPKIIIDYREKNCLVPSSLVKEGFEIEFKELKVADYLVKDVAIERKTVTDFVNSMINRRLIKQLEELNQYPDRLLLIEGLEEQELYNDNNFQGVSANAIRGFMLSILLKHKVPIIFTKNSFDTARFISVLSRKKEKEAPLNVNKRTFNQKERLQFILESFPGVGPKTAKKLLEKFKSLKNIANASEEELKEVLGQKAGIVKNLFEEEY